MVFSNPSAHGRSLLPALSGLALLVSVALQVNGWVLGVLPFHQPTPLWPSVVVWYPTLNRGIAYSGLAHWPKELLLVLTGALLLLLAWVGWPAFRNERWGRLGWVLVLGGGLANWLDRLVDGVVTDYFALQFISFPVFNVADVAITLGMGVLLLGLGWRFQQQQRRNPVTTITPARLPGPRVASLDCDIAPVHDGGPLR